MTTNKTPRLGLMKPQGSDQFSPDDFVQTFGILDQYPGIKCYPDYNSLPKNLTSNQHGQIYATVDTIATYGSPCLWLWNKPGSAAGAWTRANSLGFLNPPNDAASHLSADKGTTSTDIGSPAVDITRTFTVPGGRECMIIADVVEVTSTANPASAQIGLRVGVGSGSGFTPGLVRRAAVISNSGSTGSGATMVFVVGRTAPGTVYTTQLVHAGDGHAGTFTMRSGASLIVIEI